jgi:hypothetical protein
MRHIPNQAAHGFDLFQLIRHLQVSTGFEKIALQSSYQLPLSQNLSGL